MRDRQVEEASPALRRILDCLDTPAQILSEIYVTLAQNRLAVALLGEQTEYHGLRRSLIYRWFTEASTRDLYHPGDHDDYSRNYVAALRAAHGRGEGSQAEQCVERLLVESEEFVALWARHEVARRPFCVKRFLHPLVGAIAMDCQTLTSDNPAERLVVFTPSTPDDERKLRRLREI